MAKANGYFWAANATAEVLSWVGATGAEVVYLLPQHNNLIHKGYPTTSLLF